MSDWQDGVGGGGHYKGITKLFVLTGTVLYPDYSGDHTNLYAY